MGFTKNILYQTVKPAFMGHLNIPDKVTRAYMTGVPPSQVTLTWDTVLRKCPLIRRCPLIRMSLDQRMSSHQNVP